MSVEKDVLEGTNLGFGFQGYDAVEVIDVYGTTGSTVLERMYNAQLLNNVPLWGDLHPSIPNMRVISKRVTPLGADATNVRIQIFWGRPEPFTQPASTAAVDATVFSGVTIREFPTLFDKDGVQLKTERTNGTETEVQTQIARINFPVLVLGATRKEPTNPADKAATYVNTVNSIPIWGEAARRWLCTRLEGTSDDGGDSFDVTYEFQRSPLLRYGPNITESYSGWENVNVHSVDGRPIENPTFGETLTITQVFEAQNFANLNLNLR